MTKILLICYKLQVVAYCVANNVVKNVIFSQMTEYFATKIERKKK